MPDAGGRYSATHLAAATTPALLAACGDGPADPVTPPGPEAPLFATEEGADGGGVEGDLPLPVPPTNVDAFGPITPFHVVDFSADDFILVEVSGAITTQAVACDLNHPTGTFGPRGNPVTGGFEVRTVRPTGHAFAKDETTRGTDLMVARDLPGAAGSVLVGRTGGGLACDDNVFLPPPPRGGLLIPGSQTIHCEVFPVASISAEPRDRWRPGGENPAREGRANNGCGIDPAMR